MGQEYGILTDPGSNPDDQSHCMAPTVDGAVQAASAYQSEMMGAQNGAGSPGGDLMDMPNVPFERA